MEKDEGYIRAIMALSSVAERIVKENNAIDIYEEYWEGALQLQWPQPSQPLMHMLLEQCVEHRSS